MSRTVDEIKDKVNIVDVVGQVVPLKRAGANYQGLCPFHGEKTPSFSVSEQKQFFHCFGCGVGGDVIKFVEMYYHLDFKEAVERLAGQYGIPVEWGRGDTNAGEREELYAINREAAIYFYRCLRAGKNRGSLYAAERGLTPETLHTFGIGYAPDAWTGLYNHLKDKGVAEEKMIALGLVSKSKDRCYDKFRDRLIFPIQNTAGKIIGFGGRILGEGRPKYLNSQETPIFLKKNNLYGLYQSKQEVVAKDRIILVEGYMDAVSLYQAGIHNVAASLGTALTDNQVRLVKRYTKNAVLSYDSDDAGVRAALRGMDIFQAEGMDVRVLHVTDGKDPDDFIKKNGREAFQRLVDASLGYADYKIHYLEGQYDLSTDRGRVGFLEAAARVLLKLGPVEADMYTKELAERYGISREAIRREMEGGRAEEERRQQTVRPPAREAGKEERPALRPQERTLLKLLLEEPSYLAREEENEKVLTTPGAAAIYTALHEVYKEGDKVAVRSVMEHLEEEDQALLTSVENGMPLPGDTETVYRDCVQKAEREALKRREKELIDQIDLADEETNKEDIERLTTELMELQRKLQS